jgi:hypothetical protein
MVRKDIITVYSAMHKKPIWADIFNSNAHHYNLNEQKFIYYRGMKIY